jgi:ubiquinone biosynthesis protein
VCASHGLGYIIARLDITSHLPSWVHIPQITNAQKPPDLPQRFARVLEELGPTAVKFGQMLSSRPDLLPSEYITELERICHHVAPFEADKARQIIEKELGVNTDEVFKSFSEQPLASGSIAQVHEAELKDGSSVVIKVRRPQIEQTVEDDLAIMQFLAEQADRLEEFKPLRLPLLVEEFERGIHRELNLMTEGAHTHRFYTAFEDDEKLVIPRVYWDYCSPAVLTLSKLEGIFLSELKDKTAEENIKNREIAETILDRFLTQFFELGVFHADPHLGNILIMEGGRVGLIDFGLTGRLGESLRSQLGNFVTALGNRQFEFAAEVLLETGAFPTVINEGEFIADVSGLLERYYNVPFAKIDLQSAFLETMRVVRRFNGVMPRDFVLFGKTLATIGGMVLRLHPDINASDLAKPYARKLLFGKFAPRNISRSLVPNLYHLGVLFRTAPRDIRQILERFKSGVVEFAIDHRGLERYLIDLDKTGNRLALSIMLAAIIISSTSIMTSGIGPKIRLLGWETSGLGLLGYLFGFVLGGWLVIGIFRSGRI